MIRTCTKCGEEKPLDQFYLNSTSRGGRRNTCRTCDRARYDDQRRIYVGIDYIPTEFVEWIRRRA